MRISDWSSDVCSSDLSVLTEHRMTRPSLLARLSQAFLCLLLASLAFASPAAAERIKDLGTFQSVRANQLTGYGIVVGLAGTGDDSLDYATQGVKGMGSRFRTEEHTSELQSLMRLSNEV